MVHIELIAALPAETHLPFVAKPLKQPEAEVVVLVALVGRTALFPTH
jgi:hypothetical protein